jgi:GT2 family glycosyltransferase
MELEKVNESQSFFVSIIIISYNRIDTIVRAVDSISKYYKNYRFIVIDNSENTQFFQTLKIKLRKFDTVILLKNSQNFGFAKAVNQGIEIAMKDENCIYILLLNDDAYVDKDCIPKLIDALERDKRALLAGPTIYYEKHPNTVWSAGGYFNEFLGKIKIPLKNKTITIKELSKIPIQEVDFLTGCVLLIKREAIEKVGKFDEAFFFYSEDIDYCYRVKKAGYKCLWVPSAITWHDIDLNIRFNTPFVMYNLAKSGIIFRLKHFKGIKLLNNLIFLFFFHSVYRTFFSIKKGNMTTIKSWFSGLIDGFRKYISNNRNYRK